MTDPSDQIPPGEDAGEMTDEELRAAYEEELKRIRVEDILIQTAVSLLNLGARRAGLSPGTEGDRDLEQVRQSIEATRALLPLVEPLLGPDAKQLRDALAQLQLAYARSVPASSTPPGGAGPAAEPAAGAKAKPDDKGPAAPSRLWVPGR
jgi:hypothetical protein